MELEVIETFFHEDVVGDLGSGSRGLREGTGGGRQRQQVCIRNWGYL